MSTATLAPTAARLSNVRRLGQAVVDGELSLDDAADALVSATKPELLPTRRDHLKVERLLTVLEYSPERIAAAIVDIRAAGTATCTRWIADEHRDEVERMLDPSPDWNRRDWGQVYPERSEDRFAGSKGYAGLAVRGLAR